MCSAIAMYIDQQFKIKKKKLKNLKNLSYVNTPLVFFSNFSPVLNCKMSGRNDQRRISKQQDERRTQSSEETGSGTFYCGGGRMLAGVRGTPVSAWVRMELSRFAVGTVCQPRCVIPMPGLA